MYIRAQHIRRISYEEAQLEAFIYNSEQWTKSGPDKYYNSSRKMR